MNVYRDRGGKPANHSANNLLRQNRYGRDFMRSGWGLVEPPHKSHQRPQESSALFPSILKGRGLKYRPEGHHVVGVLDVYVASEANIHCLKALDYL